MSAASDADRRAVPARKANVMLAASTLWVGGAEMVIKHLARHLNRDRYEVTVCHLKQRGTIGDELAAEGVDVVGVEAPDGRADYLTALKLRKIVWERRIDLVHTHMTHALVDASICKLLQPSLKLVHTFHFGNYPHTERRVLGLERVFSRVPDRLFAVGNLQRLRIRQAFGFGDSRIGTVLNGVDIKSGAVDPEFRRRVGAVDRPLIGTIATFIEQKGLVDLLKVARRLKERGSPAVFVVVGEGHLRGQLEAIRRDFGLDDSVVLTGWVPNAAEAVLPSFDIFFQPSLWEAMSMVVLEAMAAGKPIVATNVGENPNVIVDGVTGRLVDPGDVDSMVTTLLALTGSPEMRLTIGKAASIAVADRYSVGHMVSEYERVYASLLS